MRYLLDTNTCIHLIKHHPPEFWRKLSVIPVGQVGLSSCVLAELWYGIEQSARRAENEAALEDFLDYVEVLDWPAQAAPIYGRLRATLKRQGTPIGAMDLMIAAHALVVDATLVTDNLQEFQRVPGLRVENWMGRGS